MAESIDDLREIKALTSSIAKTYEEIGTSSDKRNKKIQQEVDLTRQILSSIEDEESIKKALLELEKRQVEISQTNYGVNQQLKDTLLQTNQLAVQSITTRLREISILQQVKSKADEVGESFKNTLDTVKGLIGDIPLIGGFLEKFASPSFEKMNTLVDRGIRGFNVGFERGFRQVRASGGSFTKSFVGGFGKGVKMMSGSISTLAKSLFGPQAIIVAIVAALAMGLKRFKELDAAAQEFRESTGLLNSQTYQTQQNIQNISRDMAMLGVSASDVAKAAADFTNEFDGLEQPSEAVLSSMVALNKNFGIGTQEAAQLNKIFQTMGGLTEAQSQSLINSTAEMAKMAGVAPSKVIKDIADNAESAYKYFDGNPQALAKAAVEAAKLGTSITQATAVADNLLDFETSITKELEASAMLGTRLNLSQARYLAANDDILGAQQAVLDQVAHLGDLTKLNKYEQEALADATGMPIGDLIRQQQIRERFGTLDKEQLAAATALVESGKDITKLTESDLKAQNERMKAQQEMQSEMDKLSNSTSALSTAFADMFAPIAGFLIPILTDVVDIVGGVLMPIFRVVGSVLKATFGMLSAVLTPIFAIGKAIIGAVMKPIESIGDAIAPIADKFGELKSKIMPYLDPLISIFTGIGNVLGTVVGGAVGLLVDGFIFLFDTVFGIFESIAGFINTYLIEPIMSVVNTIGGAMSSIGSFFGLGGETQGQSLESGGSIDDGIVQDGKIITTNPQDTLIATKTPGDLLGGLAAGVSSLFGGGGGDNTAMVSKLDELILAVRETRDVYMDGRKVTAGVSNTVDKIGSNSYAVV